MSDGITFRKGDRVIFALSGPSGIVAEDSDEENGFTYVRYGENNSKIVSCSRTNWLHFHTDLVAEIQSRAFCVEILDPDKFLKISAGTDLDEELMRAGAFSIEANGHFGSAYFFSLAEEDVPNLGRYLQIIERHLALVE